MSAADCADRLYHSWVRDAAPRKFKDGVLEVHRAAFDLAGAGHVIDAAEPGSVVAFDIERTVRQITHRARTTHRLIPLVIC